MGRERLPEMTGWKNGGRRRVRHGATDRFPATRWRALRRIARVSHLTNGASASPARSAPSARTCSDPDRTPTRWPIAARCSIPRRPSRSRSAIRGRNWPMRRRSARAPSRYGKPYAVACGVSCRPAVAPRSPATTPISRRRPMVCSPKQPGNTGSSLPRQPGSYSKTVAGREGWKIAAKRLVPSARPLRINRQRRRDSARR